MVDEKKMAEWRVFLLKALLAERPDGAGIAIPESAADQCYLLRGLMNVRMPGLPAAEVLEVQDAYLQARIAENGITRWEDVPEVRPHMRLWQGDITTLACGAIVNAANDGMTGCWAPNHLCIDNCIHTFAGVQLRYECDQMMQVQGHPEPTGQAKITAGYNLPAAHVVHTVGPIVRGTLTNRHREQLADSYRSCYELARDEGLRSLAYCCISTGVFGFPQAEAARIAVDTVAALQAADSEPLEVIFNVFGNADLRIYQEIFANK